MYLLCRLAESGPQFRGGRVLISSRLSIFVKYKMGKTLLIILGLVALCTARVYENNITLSTFRSKGGWFFLTKMTFGKGEAHVTI